MNQFCRKTKMYLLLLWCLFPALQLSTGAGTHVQTVKWLPPKISCQNQHGQSLDWFILYKLAKIEKSPDGNVRSGLGYAFISEPGNEWVLSPNSINDTVSILGNTVGSLFNPGSRSEYLYLTWNDQPPDAPVISSNAHSKGIIIANEEGGIWIQHSVPHFPNLTSPHYSYPHTGTHNGQIFLCTTLTPSQLDTTLSHILTIIKPHIFSHNLPPALGTLYPNIYKLVIKRARSESESMSTSTFLRSSRSRFRATQHKRRKWKASTNNRLTDSSSSIFNIYLPGLKNVTIFAKSPSLKQEIYRDWIAPHIGQSLRVQTWLNGAHPLPSNCSLKSLSILNILEKRVDGNDFSTHNDHSKWAVTLPQATPNSSPQWICIADLNRMDHQKDRGGAAVCIPDSNLWSTFANSVLAVQPCARKGVISSPGKST